MLQHKVMIGDRNNPLQLRHIAEREDFARQFGRTPRFAECGIGFGRQ